MEVEGFLMGPEGDGQFPLALLNSKRSAETRMLIADITLSQQSQTNIIELLIDYLSAQEKAMDGGDTGSEASSFDTSVLTTVIIKYLRGEQGDQGGATLAKLVNKCLGVVETMLTKGGAIHKTSELCLRILENVLRLVYEESPKGHFMKDTLDSDLFKCIVAKTLPLVRSCEPSDRHMVITSVIAPCLKFPALLPLFEGGNLTTQFWSMITSLGNLDGSLLLCLLLGVEDEGRKHEIVRQLLSHNEHFASFWATLLNYFMSKDALCRKRAVHILQSVLASMRGSTTMNGAMPADGLGAERSWLEDYADVFSHLEGVNSTHLFEQVGEHMSHLFNLVARTEVREMDRCYVNNTSGGKLWRSRAIVRASGGMCLPVPTFSWLKAIVQMLLDLSLPTIRKMTLYCLLSGASWPVNLGDQEVLHWLASELPGSLDSAAYFPSPLTKMSVSSGGKEGPGKTQEEQTRYLQQHPGALLPSLMSRLVRGGGERQGGDSMRVFLRNLTGTLFVNGAFKGVLVATWAFSAFSDPSLLENVPLGTFTEPHFRQIASFVGVQLAAANTALQANLFAGLLPLLVRGSSVADADGGPEPLLALCDEIGLGSVLAHLPSSPPLLCETLRRVEVSAVTGEEGEGEPGPRVVCSVRTRLMLHAAFETEPAAGRGATHEVATRDRLLLGELRLLQAFRDPGDGVATGEPRRLLEFMVAALELLALQNTVHGHTLISAALIRRELAPCAVGLTEKVLAGLLTDAINEVKCSRHDSASRGRGTLTSLGQLEDVCTALGRAPLCFAGHAPGTPLAGASDMKACHAVVGAVISALTANIISIEDALLRAVSLRALAQLARAIAWVPDTAGTQDMIDVDVGRECIIGLLTLKRPSAEEFGKAVGDRQTTTSDLVSDVVDAIGSFGRCMNAMERDRFVSVDALLSSCPGSLQVMGAATSSMLAKLADEASALSVEAVPPFLKTLTSLLGAAAAADGEGCIASGQAILEATWTSITEGSSYLDGSSVLAFVDCLYCPSLTPLFDSSFVKHYHCDLLALGKNGRPSLIHLVALRLCVLLRQHPRLLSVYRQEVLDLIFLREPESNDRQASNAFSALESSLQGSATRFTVMALLEELRGDEGSQDTILKLTEDLMAMNQRAEFKMPSMVGSEAYVRKLRCWQCLCLLSPAIDEASLGGILDIYFGTIQVKCLGEIRTHMEIFGALLTRRFSSALLPRCLGLLGDCNLPQHVLCTVFIVLGFILFDLPESSGPAATHYMPREALVDMINVIVPWIGVTSGLSRAIALFLLLDLIPRTEKDKTGAASEPDHLAGIYRMIKSNKDSQKVLSRQRNFFHDYPLEGKDSLAGLLAMPQQDAGSATHGEIVVDNLVSVVQRVFRSAVLESQRTDQEEYAGKDRPPPESDGTPSKSILQTKVTPFDELRLALKSDSYSRSLNGALRKRQELIVCASLVDKVQNLAGIARTCEIFAVESLVMADLGLVKSDIFKGIAVSADSWLPMQEVKQESLLSWLRIMKSRGYAILGLEQTDNSITLGHCEAASSLPEKSVLLVGKEKEGIPVEFLQELSLCVEIPQYGVIRSLNVHVSTAIAIWEISKNNFKEGICSNNDIV